MSYLPHFLPVTFTLITLLLTCATSSCADETTAAAPLPQGPGFAANYPGDVNIANDPDVIFSEDFETGTIEQIGQRWGDVKDRRPWGTLIKPDSMTLTDNTPDNSAGKRSLLITADLKKEHGSGYLFTTFENLDKAFLRFYTQFAPGHGYQHHFVMLGCSIKKHPWPFPKAGTKPNGDDHMWVLTDPIGFGGKYPPPGLWCLYCYWPEMKMSADKKYWGNVIKAVDPVPITPGKWQCVELMIKMNSAPDKRDGEFALWIDGKLSMHIKKGILRSHWSGMGFNILESGGQPFKGLLLRTDMNLKINTLWLQHHVDLGAQKANNVKNPQMINPAYFDNLIIAKSYIGPIAKQK